MSKILTNNQIFQYNFTMADVTALREISANSPAGLPKSKTPVQPQHAPAFEPLQETITRGEPEQEEDRSISHSGALFAAELKIAGLEHELEAANSQVARLQKDLCAAKAMDASSTVDEELQSQLESLKTERSTEYMRRIAAEKKVKTPISSGSANPSQHYRQRSFNAKSESSEARSWWLR